jgi:hypothetical protein
MHWYEKKDTKLVKKSDFFIKISIQRLENVRTWLKKRLEPFKKGFHALDRSLRPKTWKFQKLGENPTFGSPCKKGHFENIEVEIGAPNGAGSVLEHAEWCLGQLCGYLKNCGNLVRHHTNFRVKITQPGFEPTISNMPIFRNFEGPYLRVAKS